MRPPSIQRHISIILLLGGTPGHSLGSWLRRRFRSWKVKTTLEPKQERYAEYDEMQTIVQDNDPIYLSWDQNQAKIRASS